MNKERLFTPGPTEVPLHIFQAMERPVLHHRTDIFKKILRQAVDGMRWLLSSENDPVFLAASGSGAMEATIRNLCAPGSSIVSLSGGVFGERWRKIAERCGVKCHEITCAPGTTATSDQVKSALSECKEAVLFCVQHCETSTTVLHPLPELLAAAKAANPTVVTVVDGISSCATAPLPTDRSLVDVYIAGSQKALMLPPGLAMVDLSTYAWQVVEKTPRTTLYFDFLIEREALKKDGSAWTPATTLISGLVASIEMMKNEGLENMFARHERLAAAVRAGLGSLKLTLMSPDHPSPGVTGFYPPQGIDSEEIRTRLKNRFGVRTAGGQGALTGKVVRIGHMGYVDSLDIIGMVGALELTLFELGADVEIGSATREVLKRLSQAHDHSRK